MIDRASYERERRKVLTAFACEGQAVEDAESALNRLDSVMVNDRPTQLETVKALHALGATYVRVGDVECRFDVVVATPLVRDADDQAFEATAEQKLINRMRDLERELSLST